MESLKNLKIGKWYQAQNRIFMPIKKVYDTVIPNNFGRNPDYVLNMVYLQPIKHMGEFVFEYGQWEVYLKEEHLFHPRPEDRIDASEITNRPTILNRVFVGIFEYEWRLHAAPMAGDIEELKDIINAIKEVS